MYCQVRVVVGLYRKYVGLFVKLYVCKNINIQFSYGLFVVKFCFLGGISAMSSPLSPTFPIWMEPSFNVVPTYVFGKCFLLALTVLQ